MKRNEDISVKQVFKSLIKFVSDQSWNISWRSAAQLFLAWTDHIFQRSHGDLHSYNTAQNQFGMVDTNLSTIIYVTISIGSTIGSTIVSLSSIE